MPWRRKPEADALLERLAGLIAAHGAERFLAGSICEPTPEHFPDRWEPSLLGVARLLHRLLHRSDLGGYRFLLEDGRPPLDEAADEATAQPALVFVGLEEGTLFFQIDVIGPPDRLIGALCFEVSRAFLEAQRVVDPYRGAPGDALDPLSTEAQVRAAVATIYLGYGPLAVFAAHSYRASGELLGTTTITRWSHSFAGALPTGDLTFLWAVQLVLRACDERTVQRLLASLGSEQRRDVQGWIDELTPARAALAERLCLPVPLELPPPLAVPDVPPLGAALEARLRAAEEAHRKPLAHVSVPRSYVRKTVPYALLGALGGLPLGLPLGLWLLDNATLAVLPIVVLGIGGAVYGRRRRHYTCSACAMVLRLTEERCPKCGAQLEGERPLITRPEQLADDDDEDDELARQALASSGRDRRGLLEDEDDDRS